jgi:hypothetical protein
MKTMVSTIFILFLIGMAAHAQTPFATPFAVGDIAAYRYSEYDQHGAQIRSTVAVRKLRAAPPLLNRDAVNDTVEATSFAGSMFSFPGLEMFFSTGNLGMTLTAAGLLRSYDYGEKKWRSLFLLSPPAADTTMIDTVQAVVTQRFDTTIFGHGVRAFRICYGDTTGRRLLTVADTFGLIQAQSVVYNKTLTIELINATILGTKYNSEGRSFDYMPVCLGDVRHYKHFFTPQQTPSQRQIRNYSVSVVSDTTVNGIKYFNLAPFQGYVIRDSLDGVHQLDPVYKVQTFFLPSNATLGTLVGSMVVVDTASVVYWGKTRRKIAMSNELFDISVYEEWVEGLGKTYGISFSYFAGIDIDSLAYAKLCGTEYGAPLGLAQELQGKARSPMVFDIYPNPVSPANPVTLTFSLPTSGTVTLELFDLLGRKSGTPRQLDAAAGLNSVRLQPGDLPPGPYLVRVGTRLGADSKLLFIR